jgi:hypothetical protein
MFIDEKANAVKHRNFGGTVLCQYITAKGRNHTCDGLSCLEKSCLNSWNRANISFFMFYCI